MDLCTSQSDEESSILASVARSDASAWCFFPSTPRQEFWCSTAFIRLWNLIAKTVGERDTCLCLQSDLMQKLSDQGIDASEFRGKIEQNSASDSLPILLVCRGGQRVHVKIEPVKCESRLIGHLARFQRHVESDALQNLVNRVSAAQSKLDVLSSRERQILQMVYDGRTNKAISISTNISEKTVEKHRARIMQKLQLSCSAQLFRLVSKAWLFSDILGLSALQSDNGAGGISMEKHPGLPVACDDQ